MTKNQPISVKDAVFKLQLSLLEGIQNEDQLFAAGSLMSRSDYEDVVTERSIANICGYPLCCNPLPSDHPRKGRYRISLKEHKVYDLHETYMYCSSSCVVNSKAFAGSLQDDRCSVFDPEKLNKVLRLFVNMSLGPERKLEKNEELGLSGLRIQEKTKTSTGEVSVEHWIGPSNAIEGYVPKQRDGDFKGSSGKNLKKGSKASHGKLSGDKNLIINEMDFMSTIITQDEYSVSKVPLGETETTTDFEIKPATEVNHQNLQSQLAHLALSSLPLKTDFISKSKLEQPKRVGIKMERKDDHGILEFSSSFGSGLNTSTLDADKEPTVEEVAKGECSVSKVPLGQTETTTDFEIKPATEVNHQNLEDQLACLESSSLPLKTDSISKSKLEQPKRVGIKMERKDDHGILELSSSFESGLNISTSDADKQPTVKEVAKSCEAMLNSCLKPSGKRAVEPRVSLSERQCNAKQDESGEKLIQLKGEKGRVAINGDAYAEEKFKVEKATRLSKNELKSSLKTLGGKKLSRSVTWADEKIDSSGSKSLCEVREMGDIKKESEVVSNIDVADDEVILRHASAEACAIALSQASEAVASGGSEVTDAVSEAGIVILPSSHDVGEEGIVEDIDMLEKDSVTPKWPRKPGISDVDLFDSEDSWYDAPPEGFSLTLSPFATMWNALFSWITSSSLAYVYGRDESFHEEYLSVNGREYPCKIVLADGRSSEIKQTFASCLSRALPGLVANLRLPTPISTLEQGMARLLDTMSFMDALPAFRMRQWQVVVLLFIEALSVCRIPALISYMTDRRILFHKVLDGTQIGMEEYEFLKDLIIPLGRAPHFSAQSGA